MKKIIIVYSARKNQTEQAVNYLLKRYSKLKIHLLLNEKFKNYERDFYKFNIEKFYYYDLSEMFIYDKFITSKLYKNNLRNLKFNLIVILYNHNNIGGKYYEDIEKIAESLNFDKTAGFWKNGFFKIFNKNFLIKKEKDRKDYYKRKKAAIKEIAEFTGEDYKTVLKKTAESEKEGFTKWKKYNPKTLKSIINFYLKSDFYIYQLTRSNDFYGGRTEYLPVIKKYLKKRDLILDYGCGIGQVAINLARLGYKTNVADLPSKMFDFVKFKIAKRKLAIGSFSLAGKNENISLKFDKIICLDVIEHTPNPKLFLQNLYRITKPGGLIILRIPFNEKTEVMNGVPPMHFDIINKKNYKKILKLSGFDIIKEDAGLIIANKFIK